MVGGQEEMKGGNKDVKEKDERRGREDSRDGCLGHPTLRSTEVWKRGREKRETSWKSGIR